MTYKTTMRQWYLKRKKPMNLELGTHSYGSTSIIS